jgi:hypothetical protein
MLQANSLPLSKKEQRVKIIVNENNDTLVQMSLVDAKVILGELLEKNITDSLLKVYTKTDSLNKNFINIQKEKINVLTEKNRNSETTITLLNTLLANKDKEIESLNEKVDDQKKELFIQKVLKFIGFAGCVILPVLTVILTN